MTICLCSTGFHSRPVALHYRFACVVSSVLRASMSRWVDTDDSTARSAPQSVTRAYKYIRSSSSDLCHVRCLAGPASLPGKRKHFPIYFLTLSNSPSFTLILPPSLADFFSLRGGFSKRCSSRPRTAGKSNAAPQKR